MYYKNFRNDRNSTDRTIKTSRFSLRWYDPDQVQRVNLSLQNVQTPLKSAANIKKK